MREIRKSGSEGGAGQNNVPFLPLSLLKSKSKLLLVLTLIHGGELLDFSREEDVLVRDAVGIV